VLLEDIAWDGDRHFTLHGHRFEFVDHQGVIPAPPDDGFNVLKVRGMLDHYRRMLDGFGPVGTLVELGMFHGGSVALLNELLQPRRLMGIDLAPASPSACLDRYVKDRDGVSLHWGVDQADARAVLEAVGPGPIDLVVDDASHFYDQTAASFDILFPRLRPGGIYFIEDWAWSFNPDYTEAAPWKRLRSMSDLLLDLAGMTRARPGVASCITILPAFVAIERGEADATGLDVRGDPHHRSDYRRNIQIAALRRPLGKIRRALRR